MNHLQTSLINGIVSKKKIINMKRFLHTVTALALMSAFAFPALTIGSGSATTIVDGGVDKQGCFDDWNGKKLEVGKAKEQEYKDSNCAKADGGNCSSEKVTQGGKDFLKITCKEPADIDSGANLGGYTDPAVDAQCTGSKCDIIDNFVNPAIRLLSVLVGIAAAIGIIIGAIQVSTSAGDPQKAANGKNHIRNAIIAIVTYVLLFVILNWLIPGGVL